MAGVTWIKLNIHVFEDEKIRLIGALPEGEALVLIWLKLLALAGKINDSGHISLNETTPYSVEMLATVFGRPVELVDRAIDTFCKFGMIEFKKDKLIYISNWEKHQSVERMDRIREQDRIRKQNQRKREKIELQGKPQSSHVTGPVTATASHAVEIEKRKEKDRKDKSLIDFNRFWETYPRKVDKKKAYNAFLKVLKRHTLESLMKGTEKYAKQVSNIEKKFIKHPATFLNNESFIDGYEEEGISHDKNQQIGESFAKTYGLGF